MEYETNRDYMKLRCPLMINKKYNDKAKGDKGWDILFEGLDCIKCHVKFLAVTIRIFHTAVAQSVLPKKKRISIICIKYLLVYSFFAYYLMDIKFFQY